MIFSRAYFQQRNTPKKKKEKPPPHRTNSPGPAPHSGTGPMSPRVPKRGALIQNSRGPRTSHGVPDPHILSGPLSGREQTPRLRGSGAATCPQAQARARPPSFLGKTRPPTTVNAGDVKCALP